MSECTTTEAADSGATVAPAANQPRERAHPSHAPAIMTMDGRSASQHQRRPLVRSRGALKTRMKLSAAVFGFDGPGKPVEVAGVLSMKGRRLLMCLGRCSTQQPEGIARTGGAKHLPVVLAMQRKPLR